MECASVKVRMSFRGSPQGARCQGQRREKEQVIVSGEDVVDPQAEVAAKRGRGRTRLELLQGLGTRRTRIWFWVSGGASSSE